MPHPCVHAYKDMKWLHGGSCFLEKPYGIPRERKVKHTNTPYSNVKYIVMCENLEL